MGTSPAVTVELNGCEKIQVIRGITLLELKKKLHVKEDPLIPVVGALVKSHIIPTRIPLKLSK